MPSREVINIVIINKTSFVTSDRSEARWGGMLSRYFFSNVKSFTTSLEMIKYYIVS